MDFIASDYRLAVIGRPAESAYSCGFHVAQMRQLDGLWMPVDATFNVSFATMKGGNTTNCHLKEFSLVQPSDDQIKVDFPVGTHVMDSINLEYYVVLPGGKREYQPFYDVGTGNPRSLSHRPPTHGL